MSVYIPRADSLRVVMHERKLDSAPYYMIHDDYGEYDGPYATEGDAWAVIHRHQAWPEAAS